MIIEIIDFSAVFGTGRLALGIFQFALPIDNVRRGTGKGSKRLVAG